MLSFPAVIVMKLSGCNAVSSGENCALLMVGSAVVSVAAYLAFKKVSKKLNQFVATIESNSELFEQYKKDYYIGVHEDRIRELQSEMTCAYMLAAAQAKQGNPLTAGYCYSQARLAEAKLRRLGY